MIRISTRLLFVLAWIFGAGLLVARPGQTHSFANPQPTAPLTTISVTTPVDEFTVNNTCSLREAVYAAVRDVAVDACAAGAASDIISLPAATYALTLTGALEEGGLTGDLDITGTLRITGVTSATTIIDGNRTDRIFDIFSGDVSLERLTLRNGSGVSEGGAAYLRGGSLVVDQVAFDRNHAVSIEGSDTFGGAIANPSGTLTVTAGLFTRNASEDFDFFNGSWGGAIYGGPTSRSTIVDSAFYDTPYTQSAETIVNAGNMAIKGSTFVRNPNPIFNDGTAIIEASSFFTNTAPVIWNTQTLTMTLSEIAFNTAPSQQYSCLAGGGLLNHGSARLNRVFIHDNVMEYGAGIASWGTTVIRDSAIVGNRAPNVGRDVEVCFGSGGGIKAWQGSSLDIANTTIANNWAEYAGGGLHSLSRNALITNTTIVSNYADLNNPYSGHDQPLTTDAGGVYARYPITLTNALIAHNGSWLSPGASDCEGPLVGANSLILAPTTRCTITATASLIGVNPLLGPLADHGGDTLTSSLLPNSPAIDAGAPAGCPDHDQRGVFRPQDGDASGGARCDIGAYEYVHSGTAVTATPTTIPTATRTPSATSTATATLPPTVTSTATAPTATPASPSPTTTANQHYRVYLPQISR